MFFLFVFGPTYRLGPEQFKERCRELIQEISQRDTPVIIVDDNEPVVELTRYVEISNVAYGAFKDIDILGDIEGPMPVEWYTEPDIQMDDDWEFGGPMPASWFIAPDDNVLPEPPKQSKVDVSVLHRHKLLTLDTEEFASQLDEIVVAVSQSQNGKVIIFDGKDPIVQMTRYQQALGPDGKRSGPTLKEKPFGIS